MELKIIRGLRTKKQLKLIKLGLILANNGDKIPKLAIQILVSSQV